MALMKCKECGKDVSSNAKSCPHCGCPTAPDPTCPDCGKTVKAGAYTCPNCGCPMDPYAENILDHGINRLNASLDRYTGAKSAPVTSLTRLFRGGFKKHTKEELDDVFTCGAENTTPDVKDLHPERASLWVYLRVLLFFAVALVPLAIGVLSFKNDNCLPGFILIGAFAVPVTVLVMMHEINVFKNTPFYRAIIWFIVGGCMSLLVTLCLFQIFPDASNLTNNWNAMLVGLIEEVGKIVIVAIIIWQSKSKSILEGLLIGAAVGAGFAAFETAGYILNYGVQGGMNALLEVMALRAFLAPGGHVAWAAIEGAGLMMVKGYKNTLTSQHIFSGKFLAICLIPIVLHGTWDMPFEWPFYIKQIILIILAWIVVIYFINLGLRQVKDVQNEAIAEEAKESATKPRKKSAQSKK